MSKTKAAPGVAGYDPLLGVFVDAAGKPIVKKSGPRPRRVDPKDFTLDTRSVFDKDRSVLDGIVQRDSDGNLVKNAGRKRLTLEPRKVYRRGTHWRVVAANVRIEAMCHYGSGANGGAIWSGWAQVVPEGPVLECIGWRRFRKDGLVAPQFVFPGLPAEAKWSTVWPQDGVWRPWPLDGILEEVSDGE